MRLSKLGRSVTAWIAMFAILMAALAPSLAQAVSGVGGDREVRSLEVCTLAGIKLVPLAGAAADPTHDGLPLIALEHCPYCSTHAGSFALGPADIPVLALQPQRPPRPLPLVDIAHPLVAWSESSPRGPPARA
ncbi:MAG TPA: DUF2946 domain-containing protein [Rhodocyclaceae bacterium]|nr:DUF2946 domain-containing protein [Rhodocyclaceae bacterium]